MAAPEDRLRVEPTVQRGLAPGGRAGRRRDQRVRGSRSFRRIGLPETRALDGGASRTHPGGDARGGRRLRLPRGYEVASAIDHAEDRNRMAVPIGDGAPEALEEVPQTESTIPRITRDATDVRADGAPTHGGRRTDGETRRRRSMERRAVVTGAG